MNKQLTNLIKSIELKMPKLVKLLVSLRKGLTPFDRLYSAMIARKLITAANEPFISQDQLQKWNQAFRSYLKINPRKTALLESFLFSPIECIKFRNLITPPEKPILICVVKNDLERMQMVIQYHRQLGITHFVILDNDSTDGTLEWLIKQEDTDVYQIKTTFESIKKYGWINRILSIYGYNRWFLYVDSDELFTYPGCESLKIDQLVQKLTAKSQNRLAAMMIDMYSQSGIYKSRNTKSILEEYCYFDSDTYSISTSKRGLSVRGGPRSRMMTAKGHESPLLVKHPLLYLTEGTIFESAHYLYPYQTLTDIQGALLHYKFLESDLKRHVEIAKAGNFQGGSKEYKLYLQKFQQESDLNFIYPGSVCYNGSTALQAVNLIKRVE